MKNKFKIGDKIKFICTLDDVSGTLTIGKIYEVKDNDSYDGCPRILNDFGNLCSYMDYRFELVTDNIEDQIRKAKSLIGKTIKGTQGDIFVPTTFGVGNIYGEHYTGDLDENGLVVYVENEDYISKVDDAEIVENIIKLTDDYNAIVEKDVVKVGCQNVPIEKVREILAVWETLHG